MDVQLAPIPPSEMAEWLAETRQAHRPGDAAGHWRVWNIALDPAARGTCVRPRPSTAYGSDDRP
jgi:type II secretory pathway component PulM